MQGSSHAPKLCVLNLEPNMVTNYYTLKALANAWSDELPGCVVGDVYSQSRDELTLALASPQKTWMLRASTHPSMPFIFRNAGYNKARRNVASLFPDAFDKTVSKVHLAERDRVLMITFEDGYSIQFLLFGPRANVLFVDAAGIIVDAFQRKDSLHGQPAPLPSPAPDISTFEAFHSRWRTDSKNVVRALTSALPFFNATLAKEAVLRSGIEPASPAECSPDDLHKMFDTAIEMEKELNLCKPRIYWHNDRAVAFSLVSLHQDNDIREELFADVDKAITVYIRRRLGQRAFDTVFVPLEKNLRSARNSYKKRLETMLNSLSEASRADKYERWGHLLMAAQTAVPVKSESVFLEDLFDHNQKVLIPLDPALSAVDNAQRYYEKARKTRQARQHAEERLERTERQTVVAEYLLNTLLGLRTKAEVQQFEKDEAKRLAQFLGHQTSNQPQVPFRKYDLGSGYEVWVGKNAKQNDALTFQYARKFDFWLHARGVPGSHTVLRRPGRTAQPGKHILERAAAIAAYHSKARGSNLVPVIITERKFVRKPKGAPPGTVIVEKEQVLLVEPEIPG